MIALAEGPLEGEIGVSAALATESPAAGEQNMALVIQIDDGSQIEAGARPAIHRVRRRVDLLSADRKMGGEVALEEPTSEPPIPIALAGVAPVAPAAVRRPRSPALLEPDREVELCLPI